MQTVFHGTTIELQELNAAIAHNCVCEVDTESGARRGDCAAHHVVLEQRTMDGLSFARWNVQQLLLEEFGLCRSRHEE